MYFEPYLSRHSGFLIIEQYIFSQKDLACLLTRCLQSPQKHI